jgi:uncharacterized RDD family membrane protein YckC
MIRVTALIVAVCGSAAAASGQEWRAARLWVTGSEKYIWVVGSSPVESGGFAVVQMWYGGEADRGGPPKQSRLLPAISGNIRESAADSQALHVLFSDLTTRDYFGDRDSTGGARWRDQTDDPPLAWGGDSVEPILWALVETRTLKAPATQTTSEENREDAEPATGDGEPRLTLLQLRAETWQRRSAPAAAEEGSRFWVTGRQGRPWLFWSEEKRGVLAAAPAAEAAASQPKSNADDEWSRPEVVLTESDLQCGWAGASKDGPVFIAGRGQSKDRVQLYVYVREGGAWTNKGAARDGTELLEIDPQVCGVGVGWDLLSVARPIEKGPVEFGVGEIGLSPSIRFTNLSLRSPPAEESAPWQGAIMLALMLALLTLVMWSRREQIAQPVVLPPGLILAPAWRRLLATIVDAIPAMLIMTPLTLMLVPMKTGTLDVSALQDLPNDPELQAKLMPLSCGFVLVYGLWCLIWELAIASTPGKLLFGCRVMGTQMARPLPRQIIWRNALRVIEVGAGQSGWIVTLMMLVLVTRNRQRIGDILAGTIVVMPGVAEQHEGTDGNGQP